MGVLQTLDSVQDLIVGIHATSIYGARSPVGRFQCIDFWFSLRQNRVREVEMSAVRISLLFAIFLSAFAILPGAAQEKPLNYKVSWVGNSFGGRTGSGCRTFSST